jgi:predicted Zn-dependent protease
MYREAHEVMVKAISKTEDDPVMREHYGDILLKLGRKDKAKEQWIRSLRLDPRNQKLRDKYRQTGFGEPDAVVRPDQPGAKDDKKTPHGTKDKQKEKNNEP